MLKQLRLPLGSAELRVAKYGRVTPTLVVGLASYRNISGGVASHGHRGCRWLLKSVPFGWYVGSKIRGSVLAPAQYHGYAIERMLYHLVGR